MEALLSGIVLTQEKIRHQVTQTLEKSLSQLTMAGAGPDVYQPKGTLRDRRGGDRSLLILGNQRDVVYSLN